MSLRVGEPTIQRGPKPLWIGRRRYGIPAGSRVAHVQGGGLAYVLEDSGRLCALTAAGQVYSIPAPIAQLVVARYFESSGEDSP